MVSSFIGMDRSLTLELFRNCGLTPFRSVLRPSFFADATERTFRAGTLLVPEVVFWLMALAALTDGALAAAMIGFWSPLRSLQPDLPLVPLTEEAFVIARRKLPLSFFQKVFQSVVRDFDSRFGLRYLWHGFRLWGVDGSTLNLPSSKRLRKAFPPAGNQHGASNRPQALLVGLVGLRTGVCRDYSLGPTSEGEQPCARRVLKTLGPLDVLLGDRNFPDTETMALLRTQGANFVFRLASGRYLTHARDWISQIRDKEWYITLKISAKLRKANPDFPLEMTLRILEYQIPGFKPSWLITSFADASEYTHPDLVALYHERWQQETQHREWKHTLNLSNLRSQTAEGIRREVAVQLTMNNAVRWIMAETGTSETRPVSAAGEGRVAEPQMAGAGMVQQGERAGNTLPGLAKTGQPAAIQSGGQAAALHMECAARGGALGALGELPPLAPRLSPRLEPCPDAGTLETRPVGLKFRETKRIVLAFVHTMALASAKVLPVLYENMLEAIRQQTILVRPGRSYPRRKKAGPRNKGNGKFAAEARIAPQVHP